MSEGSTSGAPVSRQVIGHVNANLYVEIVPDRSEDSRTFGWRMYLVFNDDAYDRRLLEPDEWPPFAWLEGLGVEGERKLDDLVRQAKTRIINLGGQQV